MGPSPQCHHARRPSAGGSTKEEHPSGCFTPFFPYVSSPEDERRKWINASMVSSPLSQENGNEPTSTHHVLAFPLAHHQRGQGSAGPRGVRHPESLSLLPEGQGHQCHLRSSPGEHGASPLRVTRFPLPHPGVTAIIHGATQQSCNMVTSRKTTTQP